MKINWKLRFQNKTTLMTITLSLIAFIYQSLGIIGIVPSISQSEIVEIAGMIINILALLGIITDPTTSGIADSEEAMQYNLPRKAENYIEDSSLQ